MAGLLSWLRNIGDSNHRRLVSDLWQKFTMTVEEGLKKPSGREINLENKEIKVASRWIHLFESERRSLGR